MHTAIIGLGLMGGSLALALRRCGWAGRLTTVTRRTETLAAAKVAGARSTMVTGPHHSEIGRGGCNRPRNPRAHAAVAAARSGPACTARRRDPRPGQHQRGGLCGDGAPAGGRAAAGRAPDVRQGDRRLRRGRGRSLHREALRPVSPAPHVRRCAGDRSLAGRGGRVRGSCSTRPSTIERSLRSATSPTWPRPAW